MNINTIFSFNTLYNADCIDFCPIESYEHIAVVGTYELEEKSKEISQTDEDENINERVGKLYLLSFNGEILTVLQEIDMPGILDIRWCRTLINNKVILALVNAKGNLIFYSLEDSNLIEMYKVNVSKGLALYLDWSNKLNRNQSPYISVSDSKGSVSIYAFNNQIATIQKIIDAHRYEAWVTSFNYWNTSLFYSGADDCLFRGYDMRCGEVPIFTSKLHDAGVTAIEHSIWKEHLLFSGCYNGVINSWDNRKMKNPISSSKLGGGIWRLRSEPSAKPMMISSTMHDGFHILQINDLDVCNSIGNYEKHESLAYGADWSLSKGLRKYLVGSVSFYDKLITLWEFDA